MFSPLAQYVRQSGESMTRTRTTKARLIACTLACLAGLLAFAAPSALANHISCGETITEDTTLDSDLNCTGHGIRIGAANITLDLGGHTISGPPNGPPQSPPQSPIAGVLALRGEFNGVEITNGTIRGFTDGVALIYAGEQLHVHHLVLAGNFQGITVTSGVRDRIEKNQISGSRWFGIDLRGCNGEHIIEKNTISGSGLNGINLHPADSGCYLYSNVLRENKVVGSGEDGIFMSEAANSAIGNLLLGNKTDGNGDDGIEVEGGNTVTDNKADSNGDLGIETWLGVIDGGGNKASGNGNPLQCTRVDCK